MVLLQTYLIKKFYRHIFWNLFISVIAHPCYFFFVIVVSGDLGVSLFQFLKLLGQFNLFCVSDNLRL